MENISAQRRHHLGRGNLMGMAIAPWRLRCCNIRGKSFSPGGKVPVWMSKKRESEILLPLALNKVAVIHIPQTREWCVSTA